MDVNEAEHFARRWRGPAARFFLDDEGWRHIAAEVPGDRDVERGQVGALQAAAVFDPLLATRVLDEYAPHRLRCSSKEMPSAVPRPILRADQPQISFMHQGRGLQSLARHFLGHLVRGELAQLLVNERQQLFRSVGITLPYSVQNARDIAHGYRSSR